MKQRYDDSGVICTGGPGTLSGIATTKNSKSKGMVPEAWAVIG
ncbi:hypothetical protein ECG581_4895 [Escherichia coli G58-1]|nr:hypothetical protein ECG581_4895 [Escherichia coli G58-1]